MWPSETLRFLRLSIRFSRCSHILVSICNLLPPMTNSLLCGYTTFSLSAGLQLDIRVVASFGLLKYSREVMCKLQCRHEL